MVFDDLKENYSKVLYSKKPLEVVEVPEVKHDFKVGRFIFKTCVLVGAFLIFGDTAFAESLGEKAEKLYLDKFIGIAKWIIIGKGGWDIVNNTLKGDFDGAKKCIIQYTMIFAVLLGLPWALNTIEDIFKEDL